MLSCLFEQRDMSREFGEMTKDVGNVPGECGENLGKPFPLVVLGSPDSRDSPDSPQRLPRLRFPNRYRHMCVE